jgi:hypothetical protein
MKIGKLTGRQDLSEYQIKEILDLDYVDITSVYHWFKIENLEKDFLYRRSMAMVYIQSKGGFDNLSDIDKAYAAKNYCVGPIDRNKLFNQSEQEEHWYHFVINSEKCRKERWDKAKSFASFRLSPSNSSDLAISTSSLNEKYIKYGIESVNDDNNDGLFDWLNSSANYSLGGGFSEKSYYSDELRDGIINKLKGL